MDASVFWDQLLIAMQKSIGHQDVEIWLESTWPMDFEGDRLTLQVANRYYSEWITENYLSQLQHEASVLFGQPITINLTCREDPAPMESAHSKGTTSFKTKDVSKRLIGINTNQRFDNFVVGECNKFAHAAAQAVADAPNKSYNPLYIYGSTGLGKTHLMHAIANAIAKSQPSSRMIYVTAEDFMNEMINCLRYKRMEDFRDKYRKRSTVLLVDDIQFLSKKERTQEEFFHTFNALQSAGHQIVLTSDVTPDEIEKLEPRLRTRFEGGLLADLQAPDKETLLAILWQKSDQQRLNVPGDLAEAIGTRVAGNIRELEGILNRLAALHSFYGEPLTLEFARDKLPNVFAPAPTILTVPGIIEAVASLFNLKSADLTGNKRTRKLTVPRHIAMFLARKHTGLSFPELGREFGGRDHSTVQHGCRKTELELPDNSDLAYKIRLIERSLNLPVS
jgi:chromosomal replication initiator protein